MTVIAFGEIHHDVLCVFRELSSSFCYMEEENYEEFRKDIIIILTSGGAARGAGAAIAPPTFRNCHIKMQ